MQMWKILVLPAVDDEPVGFEIVFLYEALDCGIQICEKSGIAGVEISQRLHLLFRDDDEVQFMAGRWMMESYQVRCLTQAFDRDGEAHVGKYPTDEEDDKAKMEKFTDHASLFRGMESMNRDA